MSLPPPPLLLEMEETFVALFVKPVWRILFLLLLLVGFFVPRGHKDH